MPRGVYERGPSKAKRRTIRTLRPGEPRPGGIPFRYPDRAGYIRLRWKVGPGEYVEAREHRAVAAVDERQVHHKDHNPANNDPSNLVALTATAHARLHADERRTFDLRLAAELYAAGWSTLQIGDHFGVASSGVYRGLQRAGVRLRTAPEAGRLRRLDVDADEILRLHLAGRPAAWIGRTLGCSRAVVARRIKAAGLTPHRPGRPEASRVA